MEKANQKYFGKECPKLLVLNFVSLHGVFTMIVV
jgi:hypothetical protein